MQQSRQEWPWHISVTCVLVFVMSLHRKFLPLIGNFSWWVGHNLGADKHGKCCVKKMEHLGRVVAQSSFHRKGCPGTFFSWGCSSIAKEMYEGRPSEPLQPALHEVRGTVHAALQSCQDTVHPEQGWRSGARASFGWDCWVTGNIK